ncbi:hypothetical protein ACFX2I_039109 [Malus domestica]
MGRTGLFDLERHFAFYGAYHSNPVNILIHTLFVWPIFFTSLVLFHFTPSLYSFPNGFCLNFGFALTAIWVCCCSALCSLLGSIHPLASRLGFSLSWKVVLAAQLFCWTGQFIGHGVFEKQAPALLDNLVQAFLIGPFFVLLECLQLVFGYEPYRGFHASVEEKIEAQIKEWQDKKQKKIT